MSGVIYVANGLFTLNVYICVNGNIYIKFNNVLVVTLMCVHLCHHSLSTELKANVDVDANINVKCKQSLRTVRI